MSFLTDVFHGNFSNLGNDLNPSNIFSDAGSDLAKSPLLDAGLLAGAGLLTAGLAAPALLGLGAAGFAADAGTAGGLGAADAAGSLDALAAGSYGGADASALGFAGDVGAGTDTTLSGFLASPTGAGTGASGGFDLSTIGPGSAAASSAPGSLDSLSVGAYDTGAAGGAGSPLNILSGTATPATGGTAGAQGGFLSNFTNSLSSAPGQIGKALGNPATDIGLAGLGYSLYGGYQQKQALNALNSTEKQNATNALNTANIENTAAQPLLASGNTLMSYLTTGTLPPNFQAEVKQQVAAQRAAIIQGYASRGMSTNPQQNSGLAQDLANLDLQAQSLSANLESTLSTAGSQMVTTANQLLQSGLSATEFASELPIKVASLDSSLNAQIDRKSVV